MRRVLPTVEALLFTEEKLPRIARRCEEQLLAIQIGDKEQSVDEPIFQRIKNNILNRKRSILLEEIELSYRSIFKANIKYNCLAYG